MRPKDIPRLRWRTSLAAAAALSLTRTLSGQVATGPSFLAQPGMITSDFVSSRSGVGSHTGFNLRFVTELRTGQPWFTPVIGVNATPYGTTGTGDGLNAPAVFAGNVFPLLAARHTGGWLRLELPLLLYYTYGGGGKHNTKLYGRDFFAELAMNVPVGERLLGELGSGWRRLELYLLVDQNLTPNPDITTGRTDRFNPIALYGLTIRFDSR